MEYFNDKLCVQAGWLVDHGIMSYSNYKNLNRRNVIEVVRRACFNNPALVAYDSIPERFKSKIKEKIGDPYSAATNNSFFDAIIIDENARIFFSNYAMDSGDFLPEEIQKEYVNNASILNAVKSIKQDREARARALSGSSRNFWDKILKAVNSIDQTRFPHSLNYSNVRRFRERYNQFFAKNTDKYTRIGYECLIHGNFCNKNSEKINDDSKVYILSRWTASVNRIASEMQLFEEYNQLAESQGWKQLKSVETIHNFLYSEEIKHLWWGARYGELKMKEKFMYQHKTILPTMRDSLWYSDGTKLNYFYQCYENGRFKIKTTSVYEVLDVYSECLIGYYISDTEDYIAQYNSYRMAIEFSGHKPFQITYDNQGGHKKLMAGDFLSKLAHLNIPTKPYNGKSKTIENVFGRFQQNYLKKDWFFTGQNIQAKKNESKANLEFIMANKKSLPTLEQIKALYKKRRDEWNNAPHPKTGKARIEMYRESKNPETPAIELMDMVDLFWITRQKPITCSAYGISFVEKGVKYDYIVNTASGMPDIRWIAENIDKKFVVKFDPTDFSLIYLYEQTPQGLRFVTAAEQKVEIHRGKQEQKADEASFIAKIDKEINLMREETLQKLDEIQRQFGQSPEQNGLINPGLKGVKKAKNPKNKTSGSDNYGKLQKAISNVVESDNDEIDYLKMM